MRILDFGKCNPFGTAKAGERFAKELRKGGSWELLFSTTFIYIYIHIFHMAMYIIQSNAMSVNVIQRIVMSCMSWMDGRMDAWMHRFLDA